MKVAVSIPDELFVKAESLSRRLNVSRSELYRRALGAFVGSHVRDDLTHAMNDAIDSIGDDPDSFGAVSARRAFRRVEW